MATGEHVWAAAPQDGEALGDNRAAIAYGATVVLSLQPHQNATRRLR